MSGGKRHKGQPGRSHWQPPRRDEEIPLAMRPSKVRQPDEHGDDELTQMSATLAARLTVETR